MRSLPTFTYTEGYEAYLRGVPVSSCPYAIVTQWAEDWIAGWMDARR